MFGGTSSLSHVIVDNVSLSIVKSDTSRLCDLSNLTYSVNI